MRFSSGIVLSSLEDPIGSLAEARRLLNPFGLIVLRVPNGDFYRRHIAAGRTWLRALGYNNLLGFPYLNGYSVNSLERLLHAVDFQPIATFPASLLTPPYPEMNPRLNKEWLTLRRHSERSADSPWIEVVGRRLHSE